ncbi:MAG: radical SAM protein [Eggerthellaceae bacterium]|nr:radical SAM protein [Eggerthellaceae bacterium]
MRASRYVVEATTDSGELLLYNTATGAFTALADEAVASWRTGEGPYADELARWGFLTDLTPEQELCAQQQAFDRARTESGALALNFVPTYACNYRCPYCYEKGHNSIAGTMDKPVMDAIMSLVDQVYERDGFRSFSVQWYGGDPSLVLDVVEELSERLISWCDEQGVHYEATMLSNANLIDEAAAQLIARCRISLVLLTIDGPEEIHNKRRVAANGSNSYQCNIQAARFLRANGVRVCAITNVDKVNWPLFADFRDRLYAEEGILPIPGKLCDYGHFYGEPPFAAPDFDLFTHEEFAQVRLEQYAREGHAAADFRALLMPTSHFCTGQLDNYFVIDVLGDVYNCDGWVGDRSHVRFNLLDDPSTWLMSDITFDATRNEKCSACNLLPICQGNCIWERVCNGMPCHPLKYTIEGYLRLYRACFGETEGPLTLLAEAFA